MGEGKGARRAGQKGGRGGVRGGRGKRGIEVLAVVTRAASEMSETRAEQVEFTLDLMMMLSAENLSRLKQQVPSVLAIAPCPPASSRDLPCPPTHPIQYRRRCGASALGLQSLGLFVMFSDRSL